MQAFERLSSYITQGVYTVSAPFHPFGGAVDIIVVQQQDGSLKSSPWYVQFGKFQGVLKAREKVVKILVNEADAGLHMYLDHKGEAFFLKESDNGADDVTIVSPLTSEDETDEGPQMRKSQMLDFGSNQTESVSKIDVENGKIVARTNSRHSRIFGFFGRKSMKENSSQELVSLPRLSSLESAEMAADLLEMKWSTNLPTTRITARNTPKPSLRRYDKEETNIKMDLNRSLSSDQDPNSSSDGKNLPKSLSKKDVREKTSMDMDGKRCLSSDEDPHPCSWGNSSESGADLANIGHSCLMEVTEFSQCIEPQNEENNSSEISPLIDRGETNTDMPAVVEDSDRAVSSDGDIVKAVLMESSEVTHLQDTVLGNSDEALQGPSLSSDYVVETVILNTEIKVSPQGALLENHNKVSNDPLIIAPVSNEGKTPLVNTVLDKFQAFEVPSVSGSYTIQTITSNSQDDVSGDGNADMLGFRNPDVSVSRHSELNPEFSVEESKDKNVSSYILCETERYESSTVMLDFVNDESQPSSPIRDKNELVLLNDQKSYGTAKFISEANMTPELVTSANQECLVGHNSHCSDNLNRCGDVINLEHAALKNFTQRDMMNFFDLESRKTEMQSPNEMDVESYECIVKILQENAVHLENKGKENDGKPENILENQVQAEEIGMDTITSDIGGIEPSPCSSPHGVESKNTTLNSFTKTSNRVHNIIEEVAIGGVDISAEILSTRGCAPDNCLRSVAVASAETEMSKHSEDGQVIARNTKEVASSEPPFQHGGAEIKIEENLLHAKMEDQDSRLLCVNHNKSPDDCYEVSKNYSSETGSLMSANYTRSNAVVGSTSSRGHSVTNDLDDPYLVSCSNPLSSHKIDTGETETCVSSSSNEGFIKKQVDPASNTSALDTDICEIAEALKVAKEAVEVSLCRHLLFEGMGEEAASKVFDEEKLSLEKFAAAGPTIVKNNKLIVKIGHRYFPWEAAAPIILGMSSFGRINIFEPEGAIPVEKVQKHADHDPSKAIIPSGGTWKMWPFGFTKPKEKGSEDRLPDGHKDNLTTIGSDDALSDLKNLSNPRYSKKKVRSLTPSSEQLASLNLKEGRNSVTFSFETAMLGRQQVDAKIYLWKWNTRIVISDVDGTITKSDVLGQFMPMVGKDWSQTGVAHLFSAIKENGYQFIFLSARSISQAYITREFLFNLKQDGKALPDGPVVISPDGLFPSLYREVIRRAPHEFKISCLEDIKALFPPDCNPFYAGFGNRHTDEISYLKVGIPKGKIFTVNPRGEVVVNRTVDTKSYVSLHALVDAMFPPTSTPEQEEFNSWNFWKPSFPDIKV